MGKRVVLGRNGPSTMVKVRWTEKAPSGIQDVSDAEEMGARWEGDELVTYDLDGFMEQYSYYESNE